jgi:NitT/TauT family transport system ATP-binding protein
MLAGFEPATDGEIFLNGQPINRMPPHRRGIGMVFQNYALFPHMSVAENVAFGLEMRGAARAEIDRRVAEMLELVKLSDFAGHRPWELSGGMQQRVAIARSLVLRPRVLLLDEPFAALDAQNRTVMQEELVRVWSEQKPTVIFITHSVEEAVFLADRIVVMTRRPGRIKEVIDICATVGADHWRATPLDQVMRRTDFQDLRGHVWNLIREEIQLT